MSRTGRPIIGAGSFLSTPDGPLAPAYPESPGERDRWILDRRGARSTLDPRRPYASFVEEEAAETGEVVPVATIFLTNRECPWRCLMCDLWQSTLPADAETVRGAIPAQVRAALAAMPPARRIKLYNAGSFFDPRAIPPEDDEEIARMTAPFEKVIVESHPALVGERCAAFQGRLGGRLEVAMGVETIHPGVLPRLNKRMTLEEFRRSADRLRAHGIGLRSFVLVGLPWVPAGEHVDWAVRSAAFAFECGATAVSLIPTRTGNGAMEGLERSGDFARPSLTMLETAFERALDLRRGRVFADLWNLDVLAGCKFCFTSRRDRLHRMNLHQAAVPRVPCASCERPS